MTSHTSSMHPYRERTRSGMRPFNPLQPLLAEEAMHDKIEARFTYEIHYTSAEALQEWLELIADQSGTEYAVFRHETQRSPTTMKLHVTDGWLFSGSGKVWNIGRERGGVATFDLLLRLNPTRFVAHHPAQLDLASVVATMHSADALRENTEIASVARADARDGNDNVLVGAARRGGQFFTARAHWWRAIVDVYLEQVQALLTENMTPPRQAWVRQDTRVELRRATVQQAEVYWEQECRDPVSAVLDLARHLRAAAGNATLREHLPRGALVEEGHAENSVSLSLDLTRGSGNIKLVIYAKGRRHVRYELRYLTNVRDLIDRPGELRGQVDMHTILERTRLDAAARMERITTTLAQVMEAGSPNRTALVRMLTAIREVNDGDEEATQDWVSLLVNTGGISATPAGGFAPLERLEALARQRVLRRARTRHGGPPRFVLAPDYARVAQALLAALPASMPIGARTAAVLLP